MTWQFELVAGPYQGPTGGVLWDDGEVLFSAIDEGPLLASIRATRKVGEFRRYANRVNGLGPRAGRRDLRRAGRRPAAGGVHAGRPARRGRRAARRQVSQPAERPRRRPAPPHLFHRSAPSGDPVRPAIFPFLEHARCSASSATIAAPGSPPASPSTPCPRARCCCRRTRRRCMWRTASRARASGASCAPIRSATTAGSVTRSCCTRSAPIIAATTAASRACASMPTATSSRSAAGSAAARAAGLRVLADGAVLETHRFPADLPNKCCFGGDDLDTLYVTTGGGHLYRAKAGSARQDENAQRLGGRKDARRADHGDSRIASLMVRRALALGRRGAGLSEPLHPRRGRARARHRRPAVRREDHRGAAPAGRDRAAARRRRNDRGADRRGGAARRLHPAAGERLLHHQHRAEQSPLDMGKDFAPVGLVVTAPFVLVVHPSVPAKSVAELIALPRQIPASSTTPRPASARRRISRASCSSRWPASTSCTSPTARPIRRSTRWSAAPPR